MDIVSTSTLERFEELIRRTRPHPFQAPRKLLTAGSASPQAEPIDRNGGISLGRERVNTKAPQTVLSLPESRFHIYDSLRHLQSRLIASLPEDGHAVIAICSALEGEGKTTVAVSLAEMLSDQFSRQTLLVDGNLVRPQVHSLLETHESPGLRECLDIGSLITSAIEWTGRMWVLPAGTAMLADNPEDPRNIFKTLRALFRLTIVDLPAVSARQSAGLMPYWADAVVWVVKANHSPADVVADSMDLVGRDKILGVVLNEHKTRLPGWLDRLL
jgi:non-specific protein-tyrosine kinase